MAYLLEEIKKATNIYVYLLENGELKSSINKELFDQYNIKSVKEILDSMALESKVSIRQISDSIYIIPNIDNEFLGYKRSELKTAILGKQKINIDGNQKDATLEHYYLVIYIIIVLLSKLYGGKGAMTKLTDSIELSEIENIISKRLEPFIEKDVTELEIETKLSISVIANLWYSATNDDDYAKIRTRKWFVKQVCIFLEKEGLANILDKTSLVPTKKLDRLVINHLLNGDRLVEINMLLNLKENEEDVNA